MANTSHHEAGGQQLAQTNRAREISGQEHAPRIREHPRGLVRRSYGSKRGPVGDGPHRGESVRGASSLPRVQRQIPSSADTLHQFNYNNYTNDRLSASTRSTRFIFQYYPWHHLLKCEGKRCLPPGWLEARYLSTVDRLVPSQWPKSVGFHLQASLNCTTAVEDSRSFTHLYDRSQLAGSIYALSSSGD